MQTTSGQDGTTATSITRPTINSCRGVQKKKSIQRYPFDIYIVPKLPRSMPDFDLLCVWEFLHPQKLWGR